METWSVALPHRLSQHGLGWSPLSHRLVRQIGWWKVMSLLWVPCSPVLTVSFKYKLVFDMALTFAKLTAYELELIGDIGCST